MTGIGGNSRKEAAVSFLRLVVAGKIREAYATYVRPDMRHHNVAFPGDAASLEKAMEENHVQYPHKVLDVKRTLGSVAVHRTRLRDGRASRPSTFRFAVTHRGDVGHRPGSAQGFSEREWDVLIWIPGSEDCPV
jgi:hypothetical protein